jgi:uncharacterized protein YciI
MSDKTVDHRTQLDTTRGHTMGSVTDEQVQQLAATARPFSLMVLSWGPERHMDGAEATEREHQRRMVSLRAEGVIAILCPVSSDTISGVGIMTLSPDEARAVMDEDPCVRAGMMRCEVHPCHAFPGDAVPI